MALENLWQVLKAVAGGWRGVLGVDCVEIAWNEITSVRFASIPIPAHPDSQSREVLTMLWIADFLTTLIF